MELHLLRCILELTKADDIHKVRFKGASPMKNLYEVLRQKEQQVQTLQKEIEALRTAAAILTDNAAGDDVAMAATVRGPQPLEAAKRWP